MIGVGGSDFTGAASPTLAIDTSSSMLDASHATDGASRTIFTHPFIVIPSSQHTRKSYAIFASRRRFSSQKSEIGLISQTSTPNVTISTIHSAS